ncbi:MAG: thrombospondin type 3 repeat-containing protein [Gammaproteobacteria bacterium]|nr:thrombospondin type 3 repeat-containing protein [Gammaproteobacteria bacterium]
MPKIQCRSSLVAALALLCVTQQVFAGAVSETLIFLQADGESFLSQRALRSDAPEHRFHVDKSLTLDQLGYIDPNEFTWDDSGEQTNVLTFRQGDFTVMYPGRFDQPALTRERDGTFVYNSWDGITRADGHFGMWHEPGNFSRFNYAWIIPAHFELVDYVANREGQWVERNNTLTFFAEDVNDLTFTIRYRERDTDGDGVTDRSDRCPQTAPGLAVDAHGCEPDSDADGVLDRDDQCPGTGAGLAVDDKGCEPDRDNDGVPDVVDLCGTTPEGSAVDSNGCARDSDGDGVKDYADNCPETATGLLVDSAGCEPDLDGDGVRLSQDRCHDTPAGRVVDESGCELDGDNDGVVDGNDQCPNSATDAEVDRKGCEIDCDGDGIVNSADQCPRTAEGRSVNDVGCELDSDGDGVVDANDQCPNTPAGRTVNDTGCELDSDGDGVVDAIDQCPDSAAGAVVDAVGCYPDDDNDGVRNAADLCPGTEAGVEVDATGCAKRTPIRLEGVNFLSNSDQLTDESLAILDAVAQTLLQHGYLELEVAGHTDAQGDATYNLDLSQRRANTVRDYLLGRGVELKTLVAKGYGEDRPVADNGSAAGRAMNRRVELKRLDD